MAAATYSEIRAELRLREKKRRDQKAAQTISPEAIWAERRIERRIEYLTSAGRLDQIKSEGLRKRLKAGDL